MTERCLLLDVARQGAKRIGKDPTEVYCSNLDVCSGINCDLFNPKYRIISVSSQPAQPVNAMGRFQSRLKTWSEMKGNGKV